MTAEGWIDEARRYVGFSADDEARLRALHARIRPALTGVVDHFYEVLAAHEGARQVITGGEAQVARLHRTLEAWLDTGLLGPHDDAWYRDRLRIGERHVAVGLASHYMFTAMNRIRADLHGLAGDDRATVEALDRWLDLELAIMVRSYQDVSEQHLVERERDAQAERLAAMQRLSAGLAHEVRNPLNAATLQLELLARRLRRAEADPALLEIAALVDREIRRLSSLVQEFLDFARPVRITAVEADLVEIARSVIDVQAVAARDRGVAIELHGDPAITLTCDPGKIHQVVHNLVANAVDAARARVRVTAQARGDHAILRVHDDGPGFAPEALSRIYEPFFSTKPQGTGMGLSITYSLVDLHGGTIAARNIGGAEVTVTLPRQMAEPPTTVT